MQHTFQQYHQHKNVVYVQQCYRNQHKKKEEEEKEPSGVIQAPNRAKKKKKREKKKDTSNIWFYAFRTKMIYQKE